MESPTATVTAPLRPPSSSDLPVVIQIVDDPHRIQAFLPVIDDMLGDGLVTLEDVDVLMYRAAARPALDDEPS